MYVSHFRIKPAHTQKISQTISLCMSLKRISRTPAQHKVKKKRKYRGGEPPIIVDQNQNHESQTTNHEPRTTPGQHKVKSKEKEKAQAASQPEEKPDDTVTARALEQRFALFERRQRRGPLFAAVQVMGVDLQRRHGRD